MSSPTNDKLSGSIEEITYQNLDNGYCVCEVNTGDDFVTVVGNLGEIAIGEECEFLGQWSFHQKFGRQFKAESVANSLPADVAGILRYLGSGIISGIGPSTAEKIVQKFKTDTFDILENHPEELAEIKGITKSKAKKFSQEFQLKAASRETILQLTSKGFTQKEALKIYGVYKNESVDLMRENPYLFSMDVSGITFDKVDSIVENLEYRDELVQSRREACIIQILNNNVMNGHTCLPRDRVIKPVSEYLSCSEDSIEKAIDNLREEFRLYVKKLKDREFIFLPDMFEAEKNIAEKISVLTQFPPQKSSLFQSEIYAFEEANDFKFDDKQRQAIEIAVKKGLLILTGGPGTGKTTTIRGIITLLLNRGMNVKLTAPTGRAAQRMEELTGFESSTIHRLLEVKFNDESGKTEFYHNSNNPLECDVIIVDELSMVDVTVFSALVDAIPAGCRLIMIGDKDQLPPVGAGNVLEDLIDSKIVDVITLDKIFRQAAKSKIITNAHRVVHGEKLEYDNGEDSNFFILRDYNKTSASNKTVDLVTNRLPKKYGLELLTQIQVLCPGKRGECGTQNINNIIQSIVNPASKKKHEIKYQGYTLREGDKVMQIKNNYDIFWFSDDDEGSGVFNGDIGILETVNNVRGEFKVVFDDKTATYSKENIHELELAYALTVHKSQGSEFDCVVMPIVGVPKLLKYRNLFYTALTRAKRLFVLVGVEDTVNEMIDNNKKAGRYSSLKYFIKDINPNL